jgi:AmiR/NasT family two-component response regulator
VLRGILIATYGIGAAEALAFLRRWSMQHNVRVVDAAEALIAAFEDRRPGVPVVVSDVLQQLVGD